MVHLAKYTNIINLDEVNEYNINGKSFLDILSIALQKVKLTRPTAIQGYVERILPAEEYNNTETFKDHRPVLKELGVKNEVQLTYLLFTLDTIADEYEVSLKNYIDKTIQKQLMETEIFENVEHQLIDVEHDDQNTEHQLENVMAESLTKNSKSFTKLNAKAISYTPKGKDVLLHLQKWPSGIYMHKVLQLKKKQQHAPPKEIQSVMTGYDPVLKDNIWEITLYDIPSTWPQLEILQYFEKWSHMIAFKMKYQKKYLTVTISINFNKWAMNLWNQGVWTASLDPSNGILLTGIFNKKRKKTICLCMKRHTWKYRTLMLYPSDPSQLPISYLGCKAFKVIRRKILASLSCIMKIEQIWIKSQIPS
ncbi:uncharacterized protein OCT59_006502 [Rhizophagus irregularis]|uniref:uncharacterized protein n=1 Tax=Rhizophagus irregularis TaxID=588596 RepID=UPI00331E1D1B|nr:hypothetical protein OCT59_006502 [Rhizophagus irregularis]